MPVVHIEYDGGSVSSSEIEQLTEACHEIVSRITAIEDVPVYAHDANVKSYVGPIEIFIRLSNHKVKDVDALTKELKEGLSAWKKEHNFPHKINMTFIPMEWRIEIDI